MTARRAGFTLVELLVALAILALVSVLAYRAVAALTTSEAQLSAEALKWRNLDGLFARLEADMRVALPRTTTLSR
jgi:general secretion pathway protein J